LCVLKVLHLDSVFDYRAYSEKSLSRLIKSRAKADRAAARQSKLSPSGPSTPVAQDEPPDGPDSKDGLDTVSNDSVMRASSPIFQHPVESTRPPSAISAAATASVTRLELLRGKPDLIARFMGMIVPILVEVYAASVALNIRTRTLTGLLKACSFLEPVALLKVVEAGFLAFSHELLLIWSPRMCLWPVLSVRYSPPATSKP
jgi:E3 ubiquitin-protein ligase TRIP12